MSDVASLDAGWVGRHLIQFGSSVTWSDLRAHWSRKDGVGAILSCDAIVLRQTEQGRTLAITGGPPGSRSRHLGIKSPLLFPMS